MNAAIRVLVADDEPYSRQRLVRLVAKRPELRLVAVCADGEEVREALASEDAELLLLDIEMPGATGLELAKTVDADGPVVVFVTAYPAYALDAFGVQAADYLLKPYDEARFADAVARALQRLRERRALMAANDVPSPASGEVPGRGNDLSAKSAATTPKRLAVRHNGRVLLLKPAQVDWVEAEGRSCRLHVGPGTYRLGRSLAALEASLAPEQFLRISRFALVNLEQVKELQESFHGRFHVVLKSGATLEMSRRYGSRMRQQLGL